jgi:hypothetical protein
MVVLIASTLWACAAPPQDADDARIRRKLQTTSISVDFVDMPFEDFVRQIASLTGENVVAAGVPDGSVPPIAIKLSGVSVESLLNLVLGPKDLIVTVEDGVVFIKPKTDERIYLELYDVRDMVAPLKDFPGVDISLTANQLGITTVTEDPVDSPTGLTIEMLMELIQAHIDKDGWDKASISATGGVLVIRQTQPNQRAIERFLGKLRRLR